MLSRLKLNNFKCFDGQHVDLSRLTLLAGLNASGKSTVIQSLLLFAQMARSTSSDKVVPLNGNYIKLGSIGDILNHSVDSRNIGIEITYDDSSYVYQLTPSTGHVPELLISNHVVDHENITNLFKDLVYISAIRLGTEDVFPAPESAHNVISDVGDRGQFAPWMLNEYEGEDVDLRRAHPEEKALTLRRQLNAWSGQLFSGSEINAISVEGTSLVRLQLRLSGREDWKRPINIGYGITYAFPIIVAGLLAQNGQILIVDSPEAHLHPKGQSMMGQFLAKVAASGVQVIIETHSDHVINGARLAVSDKTISPKDAIIHYFSGRTSSGTDEYRIETVKIDSNGKLDNWPVGFFDQIEMDLSRL